MANSILVNLSIVVAMATAGCLVLVHLLCSRPRLTDWLGRVIAAVLGGSLTLLTIGEYLHRSGDPQTGYFYSFESLLAAAFAAVSCALCFAASQWWRSGQSAVRQPAVWALLLATSGAGGWSFHQLHAQMSPPMEITITPVAQGKVHLVRDRYAQTDRGRRIQLFRWEDQVSDELQLVRAATPSTGGVLRDGPGDHTNCHGWIFTNGKHVVASESIQMILDDNGYQPVDSPEPGDLVVYRDDQQKILHTAVVRGRLDDGLVIVESKFGAGPRFLHLPQDQPYSKEFQYYHTKRGQHILAIHTSNQNPWNAYWCPYIQSPATPSGTRTFPGAGQRQNIGFGPNRGPWPNSFPKQAPPRRTS